MPQKMLKFDSLKDLDYGMIDKVFENEIAKAADDCNQRPEDKTARKVVLTFSLTPRMSGGALDRVEVAFDFATKLPIQKSKVYEMQPIINKGKATGLNFHPDLPDDPEGTTIMDIADEDRK